MYNTNPPLFPNFFWNEYFWITSANLQSWNGFQVRNGPYGAVSSDGVSDGRVHIVFAPEGRDEGPLRIDEIESVKWVIDNEKNIHDALMAKLLKEYPSIKEEAAEWYEDEDISTLLPEISTVNELKKIVGIVSIYVHPIVKYGKPFIGVELGCTWDDDHGVGVILHGENALECGGADTSMLLWIAEKYEKML